MRFIIQAFIVLKIPCTHLSHARRGNHVSGRFQLIRLRAKFPIVAHLEKTGKVTISISILGGMSAQIAKQEIFETDYMIIIPSLIGAELPRKGIASTM